ncbi:hypothetical protein BU17DRAFT_69307 [Hysterangium stoloniferum]|nr:hypothetical protein BU17DRAFT_69307 [Hysterangium stoloniferum]
MSPFSSFLPAPLILATPLFLLGFTKVATTVPLLSQPMLIIGHWQHPVGIAATVKKLCKFGKYSSKTFVMEIIFSNTYMEFYTDTPVEGVTTTQGKERAVK